jgi:TolB-like protein
VDGSEARAIHRAGAPAAPVVLAYAAPISIGRLRVEPALRLVSCADGRDAILQPRIMQVLVALARAKGAIVSRDDLLSACWPGMTVGEDALNRAIGQLRRLCDGLGEGALKIETVAKVGYRLVPAEPCTAAAIAVEASDGPVLAVLAFDNLSGDPDFLYFSDGVSEEILLTVAKTTGLKVLGRASSFQFRGADKSARRIAAELGASHVLDGAVRRSGDDLRISVQLVDCTTQTTLWADRFDRRLADAFALQDEIAAQVARALQIRFAPSPSTGPVDPEAYDLYLRARAEGPERRGFDVPMLERAVALQPDFGKAWALLAFGHAIHYRWTDQSPQDVAARRRKVVEAAQRAQELDPDATDALLAMEVVEPICGNFAKRRSLIERALALAPNDPLTLVHMTGILDTLGYQREALSYITQAYRLDPRYAAFYYPYILEGVGLTEEARATVYRDIARWPEMDMVRVVGLRFAAEAGDWARYDQELADLPQDIRQSPIIVMLDLLSLRMRHWSPEIAKQSIADLRAMVARTGAIPIGALGLLARHGLGDEVHEIVRAASFAHLFEQDGRMSAGDLSLTTLYAPAAAALRRDVRFVDLCIKLGLAGYWAETDHWPDFAAEVADVYDLRAETLRRLAA